MMDDDLKPVLTARNVSKRYGPKTALDNVDLTAGPGIHGLLGSNGAGKTSLIKILATVLPPSGGVVEFSGLRRPYDDDRIRRVLGYLPQNYGLLEHLSAEEFLRYAAVMKGGSPDGMDEAFSPGYWLYQVGLEENGRRRIRGFSGGMRQRLALAQAFMGYPSLVILDEPTAGLDPDERMRLRSLVQEVSRSVAVVLSTHIVSDLETVAESVTILDQGRVVAVGSPPTLAERARGLVYEMERTPEEWEAERPAFIARDVPSRRGVVIDLHPVGDHLVVRLLAHDPPPDAKPVDTLTLEDGYAACTAFGTSS